MTSPLKSYTNHCVAKNTLSRKFVEMFHYLKIYSHSSINFLPFHVFTFEIYCEKRI